ncbi:hypothetical protein CHUUTOTORO_01890 [Serratia phage vB_SmaM-ChuuTotoro]|nr:hypothetical protein CHUUTOTORO_01890 [Serratia phage vB_SmaM-ChuuTotoro]
MENIFSLTEFIRELKSSALGRSLVYFVEPNKTYGTTVSGLTATASREGIKIGTSQILICEEGKQIITAIRVTRK